MIDQGKRNVLGVLVDAIDYEAASAKVLAAARERRPLALTALAVHGVMTGVQDPVHGARLNGFDVVTPDGQPVRWALNLLHGAGLADRVYGPTLTLRVLEGCADEGLPVYLYGSTPETLDRLLPSLQATFPTLKIAGAEASKFRASHFGEAAQIAERIQSSGARLVLVGLGCPGRRSSPSRCGRGSTCRSWRSGAAFDYHAGQLRRPPAWMQRHGLEWLWRLGLEPRRLWRRYLLLNPAYLARLSAQKTKLWRAPAPAAASDPPASFPV